MRGEEDIVKNKIIFGKRKFEGIDGSMLLDIILLWWMNYKIKGCVYILDIYREYVYWIYLICIVKY